ncbi:MAG: MFS transporter [Clostridiales bacterium]|nr:MFS transporter [Clostridiales bacterium]
MLNTVLLGLVSFFSDASSEMVYPLIPLYLTAAFGATPALIGVIEGVAESLASLLKVFSGYFTDRYHHKKLVAFAGYSTGVLYKIALIFASSWAGILVARVIDRIGKGVRTAPRDVLVSESAPEKSMGKAFGVHKALDMAGSAVGILLAYLLVARADGAFEYKKLFLLSIIPAALGLASLLSVKEKPQRRAEKHREEFWKNLRQIDGTLKLYLFVTFLFTLGNSSNTFLLLRAKDIGFTDTNVVLLYFVYNLTASLLSIPFGRLSDKIGRKKLLVGGYIAFAAVYIGFAFVSSGAAMVAVFVLYGCYTAMISGAERAMIAEIAPAHLKGTMLGMQSTVTGIALLPASIIAGFLWDTFGARAPFIFGAALSAAAAMLLTALLSNKKSGVRA